ncbi:hypothetical protein B0H10DRAFT_1990462 [Mycena sp. CBHHK59/15]|nr:hypothetical protein B0H10DRAFT_1990462 [Mycena sp. CBHHK59/15]
MDPCSSLPLVLVFRSACTSLVGWRITWTTGSQLKPLKAKNTRHNSAGSDGNHRNRSGAGWCLVYIQHLRH